MSTNYRSTKLAAYVGYIVQSIINNFLPILFIALQEVYELSYEKLGRLIVFNFITQMLVDVVTPKVVARIGYRKAAVMCQGAAAAGLVMLGVLPRIMGNTYLAIILSIIVYATGSGFMEVLLSPMIEMLPTGNKSGNMAVLHSFYCWGQAFTIVVTTALVYLFGYKGWANIPLIWSVIPFLNMFSFLFVPIVEPDPDQKQDKLIDLIKNKKFVIFIVMMFCAGASEIAMAEWASMFAQQALGVSKVIGDLAGPCAFALFMGAGRVWYAVRAEKASFTRLLAVLSILCFICYVTVAVCEIPIAALIFCAFCGFTISVSWPGIYSAGARNFPTGGAVMFCIFAMSGDIGCAVGPWLIGVLADKFNLNIGFGVASVFPAVMVLCCVYLLKNKSCKKAA